MDQPARKAAVTAFKERPDEPGIYALTCTPTGERWVGRAPHLPSAETRLRFSLRMASTPHRSLGAAARAHGESAFRFEVVERIETRDSSPELIRARLKSRLDHWREVLGAQAI
jgi:hypothetical protein